MLMCFPKQLYAKDIKMKSQFAFSFLHVNFWPQRYIIIVMYTLNLHENFRAHSLPAFNEWELSDKKTAAELAACGIFLNEEKNAMPSLKLIHDVVS